MDPNQLSGGFSARPLVARVHVTNIVFLCDAGQHLRCLSHVVTSHSADYIVLMSCAASKNFSAAAIAAHKRDCSCHLNCFGSGTKSRTEIWASSEIKNAMESYCFGSSKFLF
jgi:hypothetical protein